MSYMEHYDPTSLVEDFINPATPNKSSNIETQSILPLPKNFVPYSMLDIIPEVKPMSKEECDRAIGKIVDSYRARKYDRAMKCVTL